MKSKISQASLAYEGPVHGARFIDRVVGQQQLLYETRFIAVVI